MKKMAVFQTDLNIGGIQKSCVNFLNALDKEKYEIDLYLIEKDNIFIDDLNQDINVKYIKKMPYLSRLVPFRILKLFYNNNIKEEYDIVVDYNSYSNETAISAIKTKSKKKIMFIHNDIEIERKENFKYRILHFMFKKKYKYFDTFIAVSKGALESFKKMYNFKDAEYKVVPNIVDTDEIRMKIKEKTDISIDNDKINICSVGRVVHQKGFDLLVDLINENKSEFENMHFYIIGDGDYFDYVASMIVDYDLKDMITLLGYQNNPYAIMNEMDGFVLLSRYEGQGIVFLEAKSLGLEIVMPKHLEKYVDGIAGAKNISLALQNIRKRKKSFNDLKEYNDKIIKLINNL